MIREIRIENFKSIQDLRLELGRVNVLIGENGGGKSNVLEAIAFASAAAQDKLDNEFLASRGIRVTDPRFMRAAFASREPTAIINIVAKAEGEYEFECSLRSIETATYPKWVDTRVIDVKKRAGVYTITFGLGAHGRSRLEGSNRSKPPASPRRRKGVAKQSMRQHRERLAMAKWLKEDEPRKEALAPLFEFIIYSPENSALRIFQSEGQIMPLGIKGEGLFAHLKALSSDKNAPILSEIIDKLTLIDWFERFDVPEELAAGERSIHIRDRFLAEGALFDQRSANEGFLFLLFYFTIFASPDTPRFFAIDNVDASLNPKLCSALIRELVDLARKHDKQILLTTHNPAVLDGLDLNDDEQRLLVVYRSRGGDTRVRRVPPPKPVDGEPPMRLSEAFMRGYIGGLPKNF